MNKTDFSKWANDMVKRIDYKRIMTFVLPPADHCKNVVMCYDKRTNKVGIARCHPKDRFNLVWGKAIATARCLEIEVPKISEYKKMTDMKNGDIFMYGIQMCRFIGECIDYSGKNAFAVQYVETGRITVMNKSNVKGILYEMVE